jgi:thiol-disulfide isomerase/thioredoxin
MQIRAILICFLCLLAIPAAIAGEALRSLKGASTLEVSPEQFDESKLQDVPVAVVFFASWCPPCVAEFAEIAKVRAGPKGQNLAVVGVNLFEAWGGGQDPDRMARFLERTRPEFPLIQGNPAISAAFGTVNRIPTLVMFDAEGRETWRFVHARGAAKTYANAAEIIGALD